MSLSYASVTVGQSLPELRLPPLNRTTLALFAGAAGDHNPIHIDIDYAHEAGMADVFAQGMLSMAYLGRLLTDWVPPDQLRSFGARFLGIAHLGDVLTCSGKVVGRFERDGEKLIKVEIQAVNQHGEAKLMGDALVAL